MSVNGLPCGRFIGPKDAQELLTIIRGGFTKEQAIVDKKEVRNLHSTST